MSYGGRIIWEVSRGDPVHVPLLERALAALPEDDSPLRVRLLARLSGGPLRDTTFPPERKRLLSEQALAMARRLGDPATLAYAIAGYIAGQPLARVHPDAGRALPTELHRGGDRGRRVWNGRRRDTRIASPALLELGDIRGAKADLREMARIAKELRQPSQLWFAVAYDALISLLEGDFAEAERLIEKARCAGDGRPELERSRRPPAPAVPAAARAGQARRGGGPGQAVARGLPDLPALALRLRADDGRARAHGRGDARRWTALAAGRVRSPALGRGVESSGWGCSPRLCCCLEDRPRAEEIYERMLPYADRVARQLPGDQHGMRRAQPRSAGSCSRALGRGRDSLRGLAIEVNGRVGARPQVAHSQEDYARMLVARGDPARPRARGRADGRGEECLPRAGHARALRGRAGGTAPSRP